MKNSPLSQVKAKFNVTDRKEAKQKLLEAVKSLATDALWLDRLEEGKGFGSISNKKLLHLHEVLTEVKSKFGSRDGLISEIAKIEKRTDDAFKGRLGRYPLPRLYDMYKSSKKRASA